MRWDGEAGWPSMRVGGEHLAAASHRNDSVRQVQLRGGAGIWLCCLLHAAQQTAQEVGAAVGAGERSSNERQMKTSFALCRRSSNAAHVRCDGCTVRGMGVGFVKNKLVAMHIDRRQRNRHA